MSEPEPPSDGAERTPAGSNAFPRRAWIERMLTAHESALLRYALSLTGDPHAARDVLQDALLTLCRESLNGHADLVNDDRRAAAWLFAVCRNRALDLRRRRKVRQAGPMPSEAAEPAATQPGPAETSETRDGISQVLASVEGLPPRERECVWLRFQAGLSYREIAEVMKLTPTNVGFLIHTGLKRVRESLGDG